MNRRLFAIMLPAALMTGCDTDQKPDPAATFLNNSGVQDALKALSEAIDGLEGNVGRFEGDEWSDVVPDVESAASDVRDAFGRLRQALGIQDS